MSIGSRELFNLARTVESRIAALYEDISGKLSEGSDEARFFAHMAAQEHMHAAWVDEMAAEMAEDHTLGQVDSNTFSHILTTIDDVHDEVVTEDIDVCSALEIIQHLEQSTAEEFYLLFPDGIPGVPKGMVERMIESCRKHAVDVAKFQKRYACRLAPPAV